MFLRLLLLLLIALNLGVAGWLLFGDDQRPMPAATDPGVPMLRLLSEVASNAREGSAELAQAPQGQLSADMQCFALGPFATEADVRRAMDALSPRVMAIQFRRRQSTSSRGYWVYLPPLPSRDQALKTARQLSALGVRDYYVVTAGDRENTISLGLYHNPDNARRRREAIAAMGFKPVMHERTEQVLNFYVDYAVPAGSSFRWQDHFQGLSHLAATRHDCF